MCVFATADIQRKHDGYLHRSRSWTSREHEFNDSATRYFTDDLVPPEISCKWIITILRETNLNNARKSIFLQDASVGNNYQLVFLRCCLSVWKHNGHRWDRLTVQNFRQVCDLPLVSTLVSRYVCMCVTFCVNVCCQVANIRKKISLIDSDISSRMVHVPFSLKLTFIFKVKVVSFY